MGAHLCQINSIGLRLALVPGVVSLWEKQMGPDAQPLISV